MGVGANYQNNYDRYKQEQATIAQENRMYETTMRKEKELYARQQERGLKERNAKADAMEAAGTYAPEEIDAVRGGLELSGSFQTEQQVAAARAQGEAGIQGKLDAIRNDPNLSEEQKQQAIESQMGVGQTAAQKNLAMVDEIVSGATDEQGNINLSQGDKFKLAALGVKIPQEKQIELTAAVAKDVWKESKSTAEAKYGPDGLYKDNEIIMMANKADPENPIEPGPGAVDIARNKLIAKDTYEGYIMGTSIITGGPAPQTPDGLSINPDEAAAIIEENMLDTTGHPTPEPDMAVGHQQGVLSPPGGVNTFKEDVGEFVDYSGRNVQDKPKRTRQEQLDSFNQQTDMSVNGIINRMGNN